MRINSHTGDRVVSSKSTRAWSAVLLVCGLSATGPALAQGNPESAAGVLEQRCATCHQVVGYAEPTRRLGFDAPPFQSIVDDSAWYTRPRLLVILRQPHYPMSTFLLSTTDVNNVIAYIESLRGL